ncbi:MAG TPA: amidohydrolase family protein [Terriglobales bacterium]|jgi:predicted TIM-barrel fold metal-dependent hydrolase|nr:amidohydrolase family protein [Terriglobales bacterium]
MRSTLKVLLSALVGFACSYLPAQIADPDLLAEISRIKVVDNHAHPLVVRPEGVRDTEWESLAFHGAGSSGTAVAPEEELVPFRMRPGSPDLARAWRALYGFAPARTTKESIGELVQTKERIQRERGDDYPAWVLDQLGVEVMLSNRMSMGKGLGAPRFRWVSYVDALLFPLDNAELKLGNPDLQRFYTSLEVVRQRFLAEQKLKALPPTLDGYVSQLVAPLLARQRAEGAVAVKFVAGYVRTLDFADVPEAEARRIYARYVRGGVPPAGEYKKLQDFLFRRVAREAGRAGLAVHIHTGFGIGSYYNVSGSNPLLLESAFDDPALRQTTFVIIHGGWPFARQTAALLLKPNVYADFSAIAFLIYPRELSEVIRSWMEIAPQKVMFGSDGFDLGYKFLSWEEFCWIGADSSRQALALALTGMMNDGEISRAEASRLANMVLHDNAVQLYHLGPQSAH